MSKLIICIDGLGKDMIYKEHTPFMHEFGKNNYFCMLETLFAFTEEYSFFSGQTPKEHKKWLEFDFTEKSVFSNPLVKLFSFNTQLRDYVSVAIQLMKGRTWLSRLYNIPSNKVRYFDSCIKKGLWKLDYFRDKSFAIYKWPLLITNSKNNDKDEKIKIVLKKENDMEKLQRLLNEKGKDIYYTQLMGIDKTFHEFGKHSNEAKIALKVMDNTIKKFVERFISENKNPEIIIWSDHGFADINRYINIEKILPKSGDYIYFLAGTTVHFWFKDESVKEDILKRVKDIKEVKVLDESLMKKYSIPKGKKHGDLILFIEKGDYFFPNFYQRKESEKFKGMHGYPDDKELNGFLITNIIKKGKNNLKMKDAIKLIQ